jgi:hypothetical protein
VAVFVIVYACPFLRVILAVIVTGNILVLFGHRVQVSMIV